MAEMTAVKIKKFFPSKFMYKDMIINEATFFNFHNNTRFVISSRLLQFPGMWLNPFRSVPYVYRWSPQDEAVLPEHYKQRCREFMYGEPKPVHWRPDPTRYWVEEDTGQRHKVINAPIPVVYPDNCNKGLWGGEGIVFGYYTRPEKNRMKQKKIATLPRVWVPELTKRVLYSEILDRWMAIMITDRAEFLIDEAFGLDFYILQTSEVDLCSKLAMDLRREMLITLANKSMYPDNPVKRDKVYKKYEKFIIPAEEAEWIGLPVYKAVEKAKALEAEKNPPQPLKDLYLVDLVQKLNISAEAKV